MTDSSTAELAGVPNVAARPAGGTLRGARVLGVGQLVFAAWCLVLLVAVGSLMAGHWYTLPRPEPGDPRLARGLNALRGPTEGDHWLAAHVLYAECRCSRRILDHLLQSRRPEWVVEKIVLVGPHPEYERRARAAGFVVEIVGKAELAERFGLVAAPLLAIVNPTGSVVYSGGYTDRKQGPNIRDIELIEQARRTGAASELPLFGCAVSARLQELLDPLRLKYARGE